MPSRKMRRSSCQWDCINCIWKHCRVVEHVHPRINVKCIRLPCTPQLVVHWGRRNPPNMYGKRALTLYDSNLGERKPRWGRDHRLAFKQSSFRIHEAPPKQRLLSKQNLLLATKSMVLKQNITKPLLMDPSNLLKSSTRPCKEAMKAKLRQMQAKLKQLLEPLVQRTEQQTKTYNKGLFRKCSITIIDSVSVI